MTNSNKLKQNPSLHLTNTNKSRLQNDLSIAWRHVLHEGYKQIAVVREIRDTRRTNRAFAHALRQCRIARGISQETLALQLEMARSYISGLERGKHNPTVDIAIRISQVLDISFMRFAEQIEREYLKHGSRHPKSS